MNLKEYDISTEAWREYDWPARGGSPYRINNPKELFIRPGGTTHRVVDGDGIVHCVPSVGVQGCVLRWQNHDSRRPVNF